MVPPSYSSYIRRMKDMAGGQFLLDSLSVFAIDNIWEETPEKFMVLNVLSNPGIAEIAEVTTRNDVVNSEKKSRFAITRLYTAPHSLQAVATDDFLDAFADRMITCDAQSGKYTYQKAKHPSYIRNIIEPFERAVESLPDFGDTPIVAAVPSDAFKCAKAIIFALQHKYPHLHALEYLPSEAEYTSKKRAVYLRESPWAMQIHTTSGDLDPITIIKGSAKTPLMLTVPLDDATLNSQFDGDAKWRDILPNGIEADAEIGGEKLVSFTIKATYDALQNVLVTVQTLDDNALTNQYLHYGVKPDDEAAEAETSKLAPTTATETFEAVITEDATAEEAESAQAKAEDPAAAEKTDENAPKQQEADGKEIVVIGPDLFIKDTNIIGHVRVGIPALITPMLLDELEKQRKSKPSKAEKEMQQTLTEALDSIATWLDTDQIIYEAERTAKKQYGKTFHPMRDIILYLQAQGMSPIIYTEDENLAAILAAEGLTAGSHDDFKRSKYYTRRPKSAGRCKLKGWQSARQAEYTANESGALIMPDLNAYHQLPDIISHISDKCMAVMPPAVAAELLYPGQDKKRGAAKLTKKAKEAAEKAQTWTNTTQLRVIEQRAVEMRMSTEWSGKYMYDWSPKTSNSTNNMLRVAMALTSGYGSNDKNKYEVTGQNVVVVSDDPYLGLKVNLAHSYLTKQYGSPANLIWMTTEEFTQSPYYTADAKNPSDYTVKP